ncbi:MAG: hypothetical protein AAF346_00020 [Pseudomonadota bacterium]
MSDEAKKTTMIFHHERCDPSKWTVSDWQLMAEYMRTGSLQAAAAMSRKMGVQVVLDDRHAQRTGGDLEAVGFTDMEDAKEMYAFDCINEIHDEKDLEDVFAFRALYAGPIEFASAVPIGDINGIFEGYEYEVFGTEVEAQKHHESLREDAA